MTITKASTVSTIALAAGLLLPTQARAEDRKLNLKQDKAYEHVVAPIFASVCSSCHGAEKKKGKLALHTKEEILKAEVIVAGDPAASSVVERIMLPADDEDVMPPEGKTQLSAEQKKLLEWWIAEGADFEKKIAELKVPDDVRAILSGMVYAPPKVVQIKKAFDLPEPASAADEGAVSAIEKSGVLIMPLAQDTKYLSANALNVAKSYNDAQVKLLVPVKEHLTWLDLSRSAIGDGAAGDIGQLAKLTKLHLENTGIGDAMLSEVGKLTNLEYLNLYGTKVTDAGLDHLKGLKNLKKLYVWQTGVTEEGAKKLKDALPGVDVNLGWKAPAAKKEDKPAEPKKEEETEKK